MSNVLGKLKNVVTTLFSRTAENTAGDADGNEPRARPHIHVLATGGTIAGTARTDGQTAYQAATLGIDALLDTVPDIRRLARLTSGQIAAIGSQDMDDALWLALARRTGELLASDEVDGVVITHGTDTLEETAYFLDLTLASDKPVVLAGAMRPADAVGADGPLNLSDAVAVAISPAARGRGVLTVMQGELFAARGLTKLSTLAARAFGTRDLGPLGWVHGGQPVFHAPARRAPHNFDISQLEALPAVGIVYGYANALAAPVGALVDAHCRGIVVAGVGNGNLHHDLLDALDAAVRAGVVVVRASRVFSGPTTRNGEVDDDRHGFVAAGLLSPQQARVLLQLALTRTQNATEIQALFDAV